MTHRLFFSPLIWGLAVGVAVLAQPAARGQSTSTWDVKAGYDLFQTDASQTMFPGLGNLMGVPIGEFNFGSGLVSTGPTDTIVQRMSDVTVPTTPGSMGSTPLTLLALQLETVTPVNFMGLGLNNYFVTLDPTTGSTGALNITFASNAGGTFASSLDVFFDIHMGSLTGPVVVADQEIMLSSVPTPWGRIPPPGTVLIPGVNEFLQGDENRNGDFFLGPGVEIHQGPHGVYEAGSTIPEPSSWVLGAIAVVIGMAGAGWRRRRSA